MLAEAQRPSITPTVRDAVVTRADTMSPITHERFDQVKFRDAWQAIQDQLIEWGRHPSELDDEEGTNPPSGETISRASQLAAELSRQLRPAPTRVVPDVRGGIVLELQRGGIFESIHVQTDGLIEHRVFENHRLLVREFLDVGAG